MYEQDEEYLDEGEDGDEISNEIWQEACWTVISAYFEEKGNLMINVFEMYLNIALKVW